MLRPIEMRRREPADAAAHDDEIVVFVRLFEAACLRPKIAVAQAVRGFKRAGMAAAQPRQRRRIVTGRVLQRRLGSEGSRDSVGGQPGGGGAAHGNWDAIEKVASRDRRRFIGHQSFYLSLAASASRIRSASTAMSTPARSWDSFITTRESRPPQPRPIASVISASVRLHSRIGTPSSRPSALASETSLWASLSENAGGS